MTASVTPLFPDTGSQSAPIVEVDLSIAAVTLQARRVDAARRFLARRDRTLEISFFDVDGTELTVSPAESGLEFVTAAAVAFPLADTPGDRDVMVGVTDPIRTDALTDPCGTLSAIEDAIADLMQQFRMHPAERQP